MDRQSLIRQVVEEFLHRRDSGEDVAVEDVIRSQPQLLPELRVELSKARQIAEARRRSTVDSVDVRMTTDPGAEFAARSGIARRLSEPYPNRVGPYRILRPLGVGGMAVVYLAEHDQQKRGVVALKLIHPGADGKQLSARFDAERQALARMGHPGIAKVLDAGISEDGRPYFAMEYVPGAAITDYCAERRLTMRQKLELYAHVCLAVAHAHERGIIHRDLKPSNVLVTEIDGTPTPKVIDFGMAKALAERLTEMTLVTQPGDMLGTPAYMSPEQARGDSLCAAERTDVYSLGVILFEVLTGELPFRGNSQMIIQQVVHEEPPPPSMFDDQIPRSIEMVCLKAMAKEPGHRYASAGKLADDIARFLSGKEVLARPMNSFARCWMWCRRAERIHDAGVFAVFCSLLLTGWALLGLVVVALGMPEVDGQDLQRGKAIAGLLGVGFGMWAPMGLIGWRAMKRRLWSLWSGVGFSAFLVCFVSLWGLLSVTQPSFGPMSFGGLYQEPAVRLPVASLLWMLSVIQCFAYITALVAFYSNREVMKWSQSPWYSPRRPR